MPADVVLLGAPGAGKGTQARILRREHGYRQISTGDLLRDHRVRGTDLGIAAESYMRQGELVPDDLIVAMVEHELGDQTAVLFDGFPRTRAQAEALDSLLSSRGRGIAQAIFFDVDRAELEKRLSGRWTNPRTGRIYHEEFNPPRVAGIDDQDGGPLIQREDDKRETVKRRLDIFEERTLPLVGYYNDRDSHRLVSVDASKPIEEVTEDILKALNLRPSPWLSR